MVFSKKISHCRVCEIETHMVKNFGEFVSCGVFPESQTKTVPSGTLEIRICPNCGLVQLGHDFELSLLYTNSYGYRSGINESMVAHLGIIRDEILDNIQRISNFSHLDIGSNDGTLINLVRSKVNSINPKATIRQMGVDPSGSQYMENYVNSKLVNSIFDLTLATQLNTKFDVITSIAMLYDLPDPRNFFSGIKKILAKEGIWISEQSYFFSMVEQNAFDTICHEHIEYYSLSDISNLCELVGLEIFDVKFDHTNGGSFRFFAQHINGSRKKSNIIQTVLENEKQRNKKLEFLQMIERVDQVKIEMMKFLQDCKRLGNVIHGYGASTKGNTLLQYFKVSNDLISFIADRNENKYGKFTPGTNIPIISEYESRRKNPYAYIVLPWHFKDAILTREKTFMQNSGVKFFFPLPYWSLIEFH